MTPLMTHLPRALAGALLMTATAHASDSPVAPPATADDFMQRARHALAEMPQESNSNSNSNPNPQQDGHEKTLSSALQQRLDRRFDEAHAAVRPKWYQAANIDEITTGGPGAARVYRITTAALTYCMTYAKDGGSPSYSLCD